MNNTRTGVLGEELAEIMLLEKGYTILARNFRCRYGEIDIIAAKNCGRGSESVTAAKRQKIRRCALCYISMCQRRFEAIDFQVVDINADHLEGLEF